MNTTRFSSLFVLLLASLSLFATHNRAGEITYSFTGNNTITAVVTTYTNASSVIVDRDSLPISWGDGTSEIIARTNGTGIILQNHYKINQYQASHIYLTAPAAGFVVISMTDPNRSSTIVNISNSVNSEFYIEDTIWWAGQPSNHGPVLLYPPIDYAYVGDTFFHNPAAYDVEADSLTFDFAVPLQFSGIQVPGYISPEQIPTSSISNKLTIDHLTGELIWATPQEVGMYNIAIIVHEYRFGILLSTTTRDMVIVVITDSLQQPRLQGHLSDTFITSSTTISLLYGGASSDPLLMDTMSSYSGIFIIPQNNAVFSPTASATVTQATLTWTPGHNLYKQRETRIVAVRSELLSVHPHVNIRAYRITVVDTTNTTTALPDVNIDQNVRLYPIPAFHKLYLSNAISPSGKSIIDMVGREYEANIFGQEIDISMLPTGIYMLRWQNQGKTFIKRFIKE